MPGRKRPLRLPSHEELRRVIRELHGTDHTHKGELLHRLLIQPEITVANLAKLLGRSERTVSGYLRTIRMEGWERFVKSPARRRRIADSDVERLRAMIRSGEIGSVREAREWARERLNADYTISGMRELLGREFPVGRRLKEKGEGLQSRRVMSDLEMMERRLVEFLNLLPISLTAKEWIIAFKAALQVLIPHAGRIAVSLNTSSGLKEGEEEGTAGIRFIETQNIGNETLSHKTHLSSTDLRYSTTVEGILNAMHAGGIDFQEYYEPVIREISLSHSVYLGTIILLYPRTGDDLTESGAAILDRLRPFLSFILSDGIARQHVGSPERRSFQESVDDFAMMSGLTRREKEIFVLHLLGETYDDISRALSLAQATVRNHISSIHRKTGSGSRGDLLTKLIGPGGAQLPSGPSDKR